MVTCMSYDSLIALDFGNSIVVLGILMTSSPSSNLAVMCSSSMLLGREMDLEMLFETLSE